MMDERVGAARTRGGGRVRGAPADKFVAGPGTLKGCLPVSQE